MSVKNRIYLSLLLLSLLPLAAVSLLNQQMSEEALRQTIVRDFRSLAQEKADSISRHLDERIDEARLLANHPKIIAALREANRQYEGQDEHVLMDEIHRLDEAWIANQGATEKSEQIEINDFSRFLRTTQAHKPEIYGEIFFTDRLGTNVAMTRTLSDYYQADEYWWQEGIQQLQEGAFLDDRGFDASVGSIVIGVVVPVVDDGLAIGVLKINFKVRPILDMVSGEGLKSGHILLLARSDGSVISSSDASRPERLTEEEIPLTATGKDVRWLGAPHGTGILAASSTMKHSFSTRQIEGAVQGIKDETALVKTWHVIYEVDEAIAFAALDKLRKATKKRFSFASWSRQWSRVRSPLSSPISMAK